MKRSSFAPPKLRIKKCEICKQAFMQSRLGQIVCGPTCAFRRVEMVRAKKERKERADGLARLKTLNDWIADTQKVFNQFIRRRDELAGYGCICCGKFGGEWSRGGIWDAGHFRSRGSAGHLRFNENNCHRQLKQCNSYGAGRHADYRRGLIERIGLAAVEALEADQTIHKWTIEELKAIKAEYFAKLKQLKRKL